MPLQLTNFNHLSIYGRMEISNVHAFKKKYEASLISEEMQSNKSCTNIAFIACILRSPMQFIKIDRMLILS
jgi:hypothetical protein